MKEPVTPKFTHRGWLIPFAPVWAMRDNGGPWVFRPRWGVLGRFLLWLALGIQDIARAVGELEESTPTPPADVEPVAVLWEIEQ